ncbi:MAG: TIGR02281 family clan AA aspartic protease [Alphaproteobacteria bacterium]|nr:MAG: TIGR02281 family clan AA aspartic protease [Alphaproteobacteria bacterium]
MSRDPWQVPDHEPEKDEQAPGDLTRRHDVWDRPPPPPNARSYEVPPSRLTRLLVFITGLGLLLFGLAVAFPDEGMMSDPYLIRALIVLFIFGGAAVFWSRSSLMRIMKVAGLWAAVIFCIVVFYLYRSDFGDRFMSAVDPSGVVATGEGLVVHRGIDGHFWLRADINGVPIRMMVDTGASNVVLSPADAKRVGLNPATLEFTGISTTANGTVRFARATVDSLDLGPAQFNNVPVAVNGAEMDGSLLGLSVLNRFASFEFRGDRLILRQ